MAPVAVAEMNTGEVTEMSVNDGTDGVNVHDLKYCWI